uniref:NmrA-like domain-containing protein n=1 Tax=Apophlaea sinclairii TaxID=212746 RepID=A0A1C9CBK5_9FLOR|nr:hypothetical protein Apop_088 [Apophlaea sinclairii]AOM65778.1 hypothetical protein Apop_088 [Apophlaea sinclairii]
MSLLIIGSTGTLGRQIVRKALDEGFTVKCLVRNIRKAAFLKEWGAQLAYGDLSIAETIPCALNGVTSIIDASTARSNQSNPQGIDLYGKITLIEAAKVAKVKRFVFFSILNTNSCIDISLISFKLKVEKILKQSKLNYTIFMLYGFFQGIIGQYAIPILEEKPVWITTESSKISYIDTQDVASFVIRSLSMKHLIKMKVPLVGPTSWTTSEIIKLCEKLSGKNSKIASVPVSLLILLKNITSLFQWSWHISSRLAFTEVLIKSPNIRVSMDYIYNIFQLYSSKNNSLENYLNEYFSRILKKLQESQKVVEQYENMF